MNTRPFLISRLKEEWNNLDPVDPLRGLLSDAIDALTEQPAQPSKPLPEDYTALEQALTRLQKRYADLEGRASKQWVGLTDEEVDECYYWKGRQWTTDELVRHVEAKLREKNA